MGQDTLPPISSMAVYGEEILAGGTRGVYRWNTGSNAWDPLGTGLPTRNTVLDMVVADSTVYAALSLSGVYSLRLGSQTWRRLVSGPVPSLALIGDWLFASRYTMGILRIRVGDTIWDTVNAGIPPGKSVEKLLVVDSAVFATGRFTGVCRNTGGSSWQPVNEGLVSDSTLPTLAAGSRYLFVVTSDNSTNR